MARSNTGGTRGFLRGKVADDLYQVTKNRYGKRIQLVRSVEEQRQNNNTERQALARMQMALLMGCLKQFKEIVDHSWETIPYGQLSIAHFVELNMPLVHEDSKNNWESDNVFDYPTKGLSLLRVGAFIMAEGSLTLPSCLSFYMVDDAHAKGGLQISINKQNPTFSDLQNVLGANANDYITMLLFQYDSNNRANNFFMYSRAYLKDIPDLPQDVLLLDDVSTSSVSNNKYLTESGSEAASSNYNVYYYSCSPNDAFLITLVEHNKSPLFPVTFFDASNNKISSPLPRLWAGLDDNPYHYKDTPIIAPAGAVKVGINFRKLNADEFSVKKIGVNEFFAQNIEAFQDYSIVIAKTSTLYSRNAIGCFTYDGNCNRFFEMDALNGKITIANQKKVTYMQGELVAYCIVLSKWDGVKWCRNNAQFLPVDPEEPWRDLLSPNDVFQSWFPSYDPDNPHNPWEE